MGGKLLRISGIIIGSLVGLALAACGIAFLQGYLLDKYLAKRQCTLQGDSETVLLAETFREAVRQRVINGILEQGRMDLMVHCKNVFLYRTDAQWWLSQRPQWDSMPSTSLILAVADADPLDEHMV